MKTRPPSEPPTGSPARSSGDPPAADPPAKARKARRPPARAASNGERILTGLAVSPGIAIGPAHLHGVGSVDVPEYVLQPDQVEPECRRFRDAVNKSLHQLGKLRNKSATLPESAAEEIGFLLEAHLQMLSNSRLVRGAEKRIVSGRINAEAAVKAEVDDIAVGFARMHDPYLSARVQEVREVGARLIRNLTLTPYLAFKHLPMGSTIIADELTPADASLLEPGRVTGFATELGGAEGHTAIIARSLGLPAVLGVAGLLREVRPGDPVVIDGSGGRVIVRPTPETLVELERRRLEIVRADRQLARLGRLPSVTKNGVEIRLEANIELPRELDQVKAAGAAGIGLLRSEFLYMNRGDVPSEQEQYEHFREIVLAMDGRPVTIRTFDAGGEKLASGLGEGSKTAPNPALGLRAIRLTLQQPRLLEDQLAAILRVGVHGPVRILVPMISNLAEVRRVREVLARVARRLVRKGVEIADPLPPLGIMIEVPGAALTADALAQACDFFAIGTNDLTQYTLAIDRGDEQVAYLYSPLHPAVLRLIQFTTAAALRHRIPLSLCGEMAGDPRYTALLLGLGIRELSMAAVNIPRVKHRVRHLDLAAATTRAQAIMDQSDERRIATLLDDFNAAS